MSTKIKALFEELMKKYPEAIDEDFVKRVTSAIDEVVECEKEKAAKEAREEETEKIKEELSEEMKDASKEDMERIVSTLNVFCENAVDEFCRDKESLLEEATKATVSSELASKISEILESHGVMTEESADRHAELERTIEDLNDTIGNMSETIETLSEEIKKSEAISIVDSVCEYMSMSDTLKFYSLIEDYDIDDAESFRAKVESLAAVFEKGKEDDDDDDDEEDDDDDKVDPDNMKDDFKGKGKEKDEEKNEELSYMDRVRSNLKKK